MILSCMHEGFEAEVDWCLAGQMQHGKKIIWWTINKSNLRSLWMISVFKQFNTFTAKRTCTVHHTHCKIIHLSPSPHSTQIADYHFMCYYYPPLLKHLHAQETRSYRFKHSNLCFLVAFTVTQEAGMSLVAQQMLKPVKTGATWWQMSFLQSHLLEDTKNHYFSL